MKDSRIVLLFLTVLVLAVVAGAPLRAQSSAAPAKRKSGASPSTGPATAKPTIVLVHGAFADATGWQRVIPILQRDGYEVIAVQNPLASLAGDVETTKRVIDAQ